MAIAWDAGGGDVSTGNTDTSFTVTVGGSGGLLVFFGSCTDSRTITPPGAATERLNNTDGTTRVYVWTMPDDAAGSWTFTASGNFNATAVFGHRLSGASTGAPITGASTGTNDTSQTCPTLAGVTAGSLMLWMVGHQTTGSASSADKGTERADVTNATTGAFMTVYTAVDATGGSVTGATIVTTQFGAKRVVSVAVAPAAAAGGGMTIARSTRRRSHRGTLLRM